MRVEYEEHRDGGLRDRPLGDLVGELVRQGQGLLREEVRFAKAEIREEARRAARGGAAMGAGGAVAYAALLLLGIALVLIGDTFLPAWVAALAVTAIFGIVGGALLAKGKKDLRRIEPSRVIENVKEDARWAKETMRDVKSSRDANA
jgi:uncharacterized membrane protein YqjE